MIRIPRKGKQNVYHLGVSIEVIVVWREYSNVWRAMVRTGDREPYLFASASTRIELSKKLRLTIAGYHNPKVLEVHQTMDRTAKLAALVKATEKLLDDTAAIESYISNSSIQKLRTKKSRL